MCLFRPSLFSGFGTAVACGLLEYSYYDNICVYVHLSFENTIFPFFKLLLCNINICIYMRHGIAVKKVIEVIYISFC